MGFDNECILNIQSLAGEYFCPVCRLLVYPSEALQSQCTHLYCKPCLTYVVSTTRACPYDGYLVTEADSKPLTESNKALAETIDKIAVHCLYHRSGCTWQGSLSECTTHCAGCAFGNSPVVCNRCGTQIVHRQVQEHAQNCPGVQPQTQQAEGVQDATAASGTTAATEQNKAATIQTGIPASQAQTAQVASAASTVPLSGQDQSQVNTTTQHQTASVTIPTPEQWYQQQQQYQQYYQQYPGYDPYQQQYQNYDPYQQQAQQQYQQQALPPHPAQGQHQPQVYMQPQPSQQPQLQPQAQPPVRPPVQPQPQTNPQAPIAAQPQMQVQVNPQQQPPQMQLHSHPPPQSHQHPQLYPQTQPQPAPHQPQLHAQPQMQQRPQVPHPQMQHPQSHHLSQPHPLPQTQPQPHPQSQLQQHPHMHPQPQPQPHSQLQPQQQTQPQLQPQPQTRTHPHPQLPAQHPSTPGVTGHQSYPQPQAHQQMLPVAPQQHPVHMHPQQGAPQQPPQMRPPQSHVTMQHQQPSAMPLPSQGQHPNMPLAPQQPVHPQTHQPGQPIHPNHGMNPPQQQPVPQQQVHGYQSQLQPYLGQTPGLVQNHSHQSGSFAQQQQAMQPQLRPQGPPTSLPQHPHANPQLQQGVPVAYGMQPHQSQNHTGRPMMSNHGVPQQLFQQSSGAHAKLVQPSATQTSFNQNYPSRTNIRPQSSSEQQVGYVHPSVRQQSGSESTQISSAQVNPEQQAVAAHQKTDAKGAQSFQAADSTELRIPKSENDKRSADEEEKSVNEDEGKNIQPNLAAKDISETPKTLQNDSGLLAQEDYSEEPVVKQMVKEEPSTGEQEDAPHSSPKQDEEKQSEDVQIQKNTEGLDVKLNKDATDSQLTSMGSITGASERNNLQAALNSRDPLQQPPRQNMPGHIPQPQVPRQGPGSEEHLPPPPGQIQGNSLIQPGQVVTDRRQLPIHYRPPHMQDRAHQRPFAPDQMLQPSMPPPNQMQGLGQPPSHMRPQGHNPLGGPDSFRPPIASQSHGPFHPGVPAGGFPAPGSSTSYGRGPGMLGPQRSFELQSAQGHHNQGHLPPTHGSEGHFGLDAERFANKRPGYFDGRQPDLHLPGSAERVPFGQPGTQPNNMKLSGAPGKEMAGGVRDPSFPYGLQDERFKSLPEERYRRLEEGFNRLPEEHFKAFSMESNRRIIDRREFEEDLKQFPGPGHMDGERGPKYENFFSSSRPLDRVPHDLDRAPHGYSHGVGPKLEGGPSSAASRLLPSYHPGGSSAHSVRPIGFHDDNMGRKIDTTGVHPDFLRRAPEAGRHLPPRSPGREFPRFGPGNQSRLEDIDGRESRMFGERFKSFNLPADGSGFHDSRFPNLPSHLRRGEPDGHIPVHLRSGDLVGPDPLPSHLRGVESVGPHNFPSHLRNSEPGGFGGFPSHLRMGEPGNLPLNPHIGEAIGGNLASHARGGEPGFGSTFPFRGHPTDGGFFNAGDVESFDQSRKRKHKSMGWCRICKLDCETVEGLELHSQTREHQKMAMDMVLSIKQDSAKKQKSSSDDHVSHEDVNKSKKPSFESRGSRH